MLSYTAQTAFFIVLLLTDFSAGFEKIIALLWGPLFVGPCSAERAEACLNLTLVAST